MRGSRWFSGVVVLASLAGAAVAQPTLPQCYFWQEHPEGGNPWDDDADFISPNQTFAPFITVPLKYVGTPWSPTSAATYTMNRITRALLASPTWVNSTQSNIAIFLKDFGHVINTELPDPATGFFNEAWDTAVIQTPDPDDPSLPYPRSESFPSQTGKVYLHPFLANATTGRGRRFPALCRGPHQQREGGRHQHGPVDRRRGRGGVCRLCASGM